MIVQKAAKVAKGDEDHFPRPSLSNEKDAP
jgi:hypothetical protein